MRLLAEERRLGTLELLLTYPAARRRDRGGQARRLPGRRRACCSRHARLPARGSTASSRSRSRRWSPATSGLLLLARAVRVVRPLRLVADRQPGAGRLPHRDAAAAPLAAVLERGGERRRARCPSCARSRSSTTSSRSRSASSTLRDVFYFVFLAALLRVGDAARARGPAVARPALTPARPARCASRSRSRRWSASSSSGQALLDARVVAPRPDARSAATRSPTTRGRCSTASTATSASSPSCARRIRATRSSTTSCGRCGRAAPRVRVDVGRREPQPGARARVRRRLVRRARGRERGPAARVLEPARGDR